MNEKYERNFLPSIPHALFLFLLFMWSLLPRSGIMLCDPRCQDLDYLAHGQMARGAGVMIKLSQIGSSIKAGDFHT